MNVNKFLLEKLKNVSDRINQVEKKLSKEVKGDKNTETKNKKNKK